MAIGNRASTGLIGLDHVIDMLRLGDNVVWQVGDMAEYRSVVEPFAEQARADNRRLIYVRFGNHPALLKDEDVDLVYTLDADKGFEDFATRVHQIIAEEGEKVFYVFDCLSDLVECWYSDLMIGNFFYVTCPFLYSLDTIAYFALIRGIHTNNTIARIRSTTQLLLDLYYISGKTYIHPLKVWERYSPTMFFPHQIEGDEAVSITASSEAAALFSDRWHLQKTQDYWEITLKRAEALLTAEAKEQEPMRRLLIDLIIGKEPGIAELADRYFTLPDLLYVASREIGTGYIGGKSVGFLLSRRIVETDMPQDIRSRIEPHDSYYLGSDVFYTYIVQNGCWDLRMKQKSPEGYFTYAEELRERLLQGKFPEAIREQFAQMLEYFGQSPIIVRSSSLLEDGYGNAFAGKYESIFCANQGTPDERYEAFEQTVRRVYASTMSENALLYRKDRDLMDKDEQMAVLVQRVSGDHYGDLFFPHIAGVANSVNLYLWKPEMDPNAGMLRLVFGLGTRAVDRVSGDYAKTVALDHPSDIPPTTYGEEAKYSQHQADVLNLKENKMDAVAMGTLAKEDLHTNKNLFFSPDYGLIRRMEDAGRKLPSKPVIADFKTLLDETLFPEDMERILTKLEEVYDYPVDVEFAANFNKKGNYRINLLQCRPLQTRGLETAIAAPEPSPERTLIRISSSFMGGNLYTPLDYVVLIKPAEYLALSEQERYQVARTIGQINQKLRPHPALLIGPGRWGSTTTSLGIPVHFSELSHMTSICEVAYEEMMPELSFGSHFFQDLVETGIFYMAIHHDAEGTLFQPELLAPYRSIRNQGDDDRQTAHKAIEIYKTPGLHLYSDIISQTALCYFDEISFT